MKKLSLTKETLVRLSEGLTANVAAGGNGTSANVSYCNCPNPTVTECLVVTQMAYCNTTKCTTYAGC